MHFLIPETSFISLLLQNAVSVSVKNKLLVSPTPAQKGSAKPQDGGWDRLIRGHKRGKSN